MHNKIKWDNVQNVDNFINLLMVHVFLQDRIHSVNQELVNVVQEIVYNVFKDTF